MDWFKSAHQACQVAPTKCEAAPPDWPHSMPPPPVPLPRASLTRHPLTHQALRQLVAKEAWTGLKEHLVQKTEWTSGIPGSMLCARVIHGLGTLVGKGTLSLRGRFSVEDALRAQSPLPPCSLIHSLSLGRWLNLFNLGALICKYLATCFPED